MWRLQRVKGEPLNPVFGTHGGVDAVHKVVENVEVCLAGRLKHHAELLEQIVVDGGTNDLAALPDEMLTAATPTLYRAS